MKCCFVWLGCGFFLRCLLFDQVGRSHTSNNRTHDAVLHAVPNPLKAFRTKPASIQGAIEREHRRRYIEAEMPVLTPVVKAILKTAADVIEDGAIGLVIGDSGTGKSQAAKAIRLTHAKVVVVTVASPLVKPAAFLGEIRRQVRGVSYCGVVASEIFLTLRDRLPRACDLLVVAEAHLLMGRSASAEGKPSDAPGIDRLVQRDRRAAIVDRHGRFRALFEPPRRRL